MMFGNQQEYSASEMVHLFADGELDPAHEGQLFNALAGDGELRRELREIVTVRSALRNDALHLLPSQAAHMSLFTAVDLELGLVKAAPTGGFLASASRFLGGTFARVALPVVTAAVGVVIGSGLLATDSSAPPVLATSTSGAPRGVATETTRSSTATAPVTGAPAATAPAAGSRAATATTSGSLAAAAAPPMRSFGGSFRRNGGMSNIGTRREPASLRSGNGGLIPEKRSTFATAINDSTLADGGGGIDRPAISSVALRTPVGQIPAEASPTHPVEAGAVEFSSVNVDLLHPSSESVNHGLAVQMRGFSGTSFPRASIASNAAPFLDNAAIGLYYIASANHRLGFEVGQESFSQTFDGEVDGRPAHFEQNPHTVWYGGSYRYQYDRIDLLLGIAPTAQVTIGGSSLGGVARTFMGLDIAPLEGISLLVGVEAGALLYRSEGNWYSTEKFGLTYGTTVRF